MPVHTHDCNKRQTHRIGSGLEQTITSCKQLHSFCYCVRPAATHSHTDINHDLIVVDRDMAAESSAVPLLACGLNVHGGYEGVGGLLAFDRLRIRKHVRRSDVTQPCVPRHTSATGEEGRAHIAQRKQRRAEQGELKLGYTVIQSQKDSNRSKDRSRLTVQ